MLKKIKEYKLLLINKNGLDIKELKFSTFFMTSCLLLIFFTSILCISLYSTDLNKIISLYVVRKHNNNNKVLQNKIDEQNDRIGNLMNEINISPFSIFINF